MPLRSRVAGLRRVRAVREEGQHAAPTEVREAVRVGAAAVERRLVELEVSAVQQRAGGRVDGHRHGIGNAVGDLHELHVDPGDRHGLRRSDRHQTARGIAAVLGEFALQQGEREPGAVHGTVDQVPDVGDGADVVLVAVSQHQRRQPPELFCKRTYVRNDEVHAEVLGAGEHHPGVDQQGRRPAADGHHVHAELADAAEEQDLDHRRSPGIAGHREISLRRCRSRNASLDGAGAPDGARPNAQPGGNPGAMVHVRVAGRPASGWKRTQYST